MEDNERWNPKCDENSVNTYIPYNFSDHRICIHITSTIFRMYI